jgi:VRR-NUC domain
MLRASQLGMRLLRFQVGTFQTLDGRPVKIGTPGVSDCIGWRPLTITQDMVGQTIAQFVAAEVKTPTGRLSPEQKQFLAVVNQAGGVALVLRSADDIAKIATHKP